MKTPASRVFCEPTSLVLGASVVLMLLGLAGGVMGQEADETAASDHALAAAEPSSAPAGAPLMALQVAAGSSGEIRVAGMVDAATVQQRPVEGVHGYSFEIFDSGGSRLAVAGSGQLPAGFDQAGVVVVRGSAVGGELRAVEVLIPGAAEWPDPGRGLVAVLAVNLIVWLGIFLYLLRLHGRVRHLEEEV